MNLLLCGIKIIDIVRVLGQIAKLCIDSIRRTTLTVILCDKALLLKEALSNPKISVPMSDEKS